MKRFKALEKSHPTSDPIEQQDEDAAPETPYTPRTKLTKTFRSFAIRFVSTFIMIFMLVFIIYMGHVPLVLLVLFVQWCMVKELFNLAREAQKENQLPWFRAQQWYYFVVATFFFTLRSIYKNLLFALTTDAQCSGRFTWILVHHSLISYFLYTFGLISFVLSLTMKKMYLYQFGQYAWTHMILMMVFVPSSFLIHNIFQGIIWFLLPCSLIIVNDIAAYMGGLFFGRTPLIRLSPKKTWEGFIFGFFCTVIASFILTKLMIPFDWLTCPRHDLSTGWLECEPSEIFIKKAHTIVDLLGILPPSVKEFGMFVISNLPDVMRRPLLSFSLTFEPMVFHAGVLAVFASLVAPFAGFFASGFKRAFGVKDFAGMIPGHGGMTDRMDCQTLMALFSYLYYLTFIARTEIDVVSVLDSILKLDAQSQLQLFARISNYLVGEHLLPESMSVQLNDLNLVE